MRRVAAGLPLRFSFETANVGDHLPDFFFGHADPLAGGAIGRHDGSRDSLVDGSEQISVRISMTLVGTGQVGTATSAARTQSVAEGAVNAELKFPRLRRLGIACKRIVVLTKKSSGQRQQQQNARGEASQSFELRKQRFRSHSQHESMLPRLQSSLAMRKLT